MNAGSDEFPIGALSKQTGCNIETIRYYEKASLLPVPARSPAGYRRYGSTHLKRVTFIRRARALGFSIEEVRKLLKLADERKRPCAEVRVVAGAHLKDVQAKIADLRAMERVLRETVAKCASRRSPDCPLIESLSREGLGNSSMIAASGFRANRKVSERAARERVRHPCRLVSS